MEENKTTPSPYTIPIAIVIAGVIIGGAIIASQNPDFLAKKDNNNPPTQNDGTTPPPGQNISVDLEGWSFLGNENAKVVVVEYADYVCPFCHRFWQDTLPLIKKDYIDTGKIKYIYKDFAVVGGEKAAEASHCAQEQGKFWEYHNLLFGEQTPGNEQADRIKWQDPKTHEAYAKKLGLDAKTLVDCFNSGKYESMVTQSTQEAIQNGGQGTPFFLINNSPISGAQPYSVFQAAIDSAL